MPQQHWWNAVRKIGSWAALDPLYLFYHDSNCMMGSYMAGTHRDSIPLSIVNHRKTIFWYSTMTSPYFSDRDVCHFQSQFVILIFLTVPMPCIPGKAFPILCFVGWSMTFVWSIPTYWVIALTRLACLKLKSSGIHVPVVFWMFPVWLLFQELLGVIVFLRMPHAFGKMLVCASLILRFTCRGWHSWHSERRHRSKSATTQNMSEPIARHRARLPALKFTHRFTSCCAVYDPVKTLAVSLYSPVQTHCAIGSNI